MLVVGTEVEMSDDAGVTGTELVLEAAAGRFTSSDDSEYPFGHLMVVFQKT